MRVADYPSAPPSLRNFSVAVPEHFNWGFDVIDAIGKGRGRDVALVHIDEGKEAERFTFEEVSEKSSQLANFLSLRGLGKGEPVLVMLPNTPMLWFSIVALIKLGAVVVPSAATLTQKDLDYRVSASGAKGVITDGGNIGKFIGAAGLRFVGQVKLDKSESVASGCVDMDEAFSESRTLQRTDTRADDPAFYYFTSGTEGLPKMVVHTHSSYPIGHRATALWLGVEAGELHWNISSPGWAKHAWSSIFAPWNVGGATFSFGYKGGFRAAEHLRQIQDFRVNTLCAPPTIWRMFALEDLSKYDLSSLKSTCSAGEPLNPEVIERFRKATGITIRDGYGQTETVLAVGNFPGVPVRQGSMGVPSPLYDIDVVGDEGEVMPPGKEGNVAIKLTPRPFALFKEYANDPQRTRDAFRGEWYYTGDRATKDADGYFWFVGRADDVIKSSGYRIGPFEVESALLKHPAVGEAAVVPAPDTVRGAVVKAYVVLRPGYAPSQELADELAAFVAKETGPYKHPRRIEFVQSLEPVKTISGKIRRKNLRQAEYGQAERAVNGEEYSAKPLRGA